MDFVMEVIRTDDATRTVEFRMIPNPKRYEWTTKDGKPYLFDKMDKLMFSEEVLRQMHAQAMQIPITAQPQLVGHADEYVQRRLPEIDKALSGTSTIATMEDKSEEFLRSLETDKLRFVILSLDIVGSTKMITRLPPEQYKRIITTALYEFSSVVPLFHGHVLKYTGDGIIAYFAEPSFIIKNDHALDCALTLLRLVRDGLNPCYKKHGLEEIKIRVGLDSGEAYVHTVGSAATKQHKDIMGAVVSLATKIQGTAPAGGIRLGQVTFQNLHTDWRLRCSAAVIPPDWPYQQSGKSYAIYEFNGKPTPNLLPPPAAKPGRNDKCGCGSGKKFKKCCARK